MEKWVKQAIKGNQKALEKLLIANQDQLYRTAYLYAGNKEDSLDIVQETAYKVVKSIHNLKEPSYFKTWLIRILINTALEQQRKNSKLIYMEEIEENLAKEKLVVNDDQTNHLTLLDSINQLKKDYREVIILYYYHTLTTKEISQVLDKPEGTIKTNLSRGRQQLKQQLEGAAHHERREN